MSLRPLLLLVALFVAVPATAQTIVPVSRFRKGESFSLTTPYCSTACVRPIFGSYSAPNCVNAYSTTEAFKDFEYFWWTAEGFIATNSVRNPALSAPPGGTGLHFLRTDSQNGPRYSTTNCAGVDGYDEGTETYTGATACYNMLDQLDTQTLCPLDAGDFGTSGVYRGTNNGLWLKGKIDYINSKKRSGANPLHTLSERHELMQPTELQVDGVDPSWFVTAGDQTPNAWNHFYDWLTATGTSDPVCTTANADCHYDSGAGVMQGKSDVTNYCCTGNTSGHACNHCTPVSCTWSWYENGDQPSFMSGATTCNGWDKHSAGFSYYDVINATGKDPYTAIYYLTRPNGQRWSPNGVLMDTANAAYRRWRVAQWKALMQETGADFVLLSHKMAQWFPYAYVAPYTFYVRGMPNKFDLPTLNPPGNNNGVTDVYEVVQSGDGGYSADQNQHWPASKAVEGLRGFADELTAQHVPWTFDVGAAHFLPTKRCISITNYNWVSASSCTSDTDCSGSDKCVMWGDDPRTTGVNEHLVFRSIAYDSPRAEIWGETMSQSGGVNPAPNTDCTGLTGVLLRECQDQCQGKTGNYLLDCVRRAEGKATPLIGSQVPVGTCKP